MSKEYRYRKFIRWGQYVIPAFLGLLVLPLLEKIGSLVFRVGSHINTIYAIIFSVERLVGAVIWYMYYRLAGGAVSIDNNGVVYKYRGGVKHLPFDSVRVDSASIRYTTGGWLKIISGKDVIRLAATMENIGEFIQELKAALDSRGLSSHYESQKLLGFMKTAAASDQSLERMYAIFGKFYLIILVAGITLVNGYVFGTMGLGFFFFIWGFFSLFWILGAYIIAEIILTRKIAIQSVESAFSFPSRDLEYEKQVFNKAINWGGWLYILFFGNGSSWSTCFQNDSYSLVVNQSISQIVSLSPKYWKLHAMNRGLQFLASDQIAISASGEKVIISLL